MATWSDSLEEARHRENLPPVPGDSSGVRAEEIRRLESIYIFRRTKEVSQFLESHSFLSPLLVEAYGKIEEHFGPRPEVVLEVIRDPEVRGLVQMFGYIVTVLTPEEASERLQQFDRGWLLHEIHRARGALNFDVEFA